MTVAGRMFLIGAGAQMIEAAQPRLLAKELPQEWRPALTAIDTASERYRVKFEVANADAHRRGKVKADVIEELYDYNSTAIKALLAMATLSDEGMQRVLDVISEESKTKTPC